MIITVYLHAYSLKNQTEAVTKVQIPGWESNTPRYPVMRQVISELCSPGSNLWGKRQENCSQQHSQILKVKSEVMSKSLQPHGL